MKKVSNAEKMRIKRQSETKDEGDIRRAKNAEYQRKKRARMNSEEKSLRTWLSHPGAHVLFPKAH